MYKVTNYPSLFDASRCIKGVFCGPDNTIHFYNAPVKEEDDTVPILRPLEMASIYHFKIGDVDPQVGQFLADQMATAMTTSLQRGFEMGRQYVRDALGVEGNVTRRM